MWLFLVCSLTRKQLHDIGHLPKGVTLAMAWHAMALLLLAPINFTILLYDD